MHSENVKIATASVRAIPIVRLSGSITMDNSPEVRKALKELARRAPPVLIVSLDGTRYVDTSGLATFIECARRMRTYGGKLAVVGLSEQVADAFSITQLEGIFAVFGTEAEALEQFAPTQ
jgi:anti-anti-sigma factor